MNYKRGDIIINSTDIEGYSFMITILTIYMKLKMPSQLIYEETDNQTYSYLKKKFAA